MSRPATYRTQPTLLVLTTLLADPGAGKCGLQIVDSTGLGKSSVYSILGRLEEAGMIEGRQESIPKTARRPARRFYRLTAAGVEHAHRGSGHSPNHTVRVPGPEWDAATEAAEANGESLSDVIRTALRCYVARQATGRHCPQHVRPS